MSHLSHEAGATEHRGVFFKADSSWDSRRKLTVLLITEDATLNNLIVKHSEDSAEMLSVKIYIS